MDVCGLHQVPIRVLSPLCLFIYAYFVECGVHKRWVKNELGEMNYIPNDLSTQEYIPCEDDYVPAPVKSGSLVLLHGQTYHKSSRNTSNKSRIIYTFHVIEGELPYPKDNWLQPSVEFASLFDGVS